jgi:hypothetical protein
LAQLSGVGARPPKILLPYQHWSKTHYKSDVKAAFEERFPKKPGEKDKNRTANRAAITQEYFARLPEEEQLRYADEAKVQHEEALKNWKAIVNGNPSEDPQRRQA